MEPLAWLKAAEEVVAWLLEGSLSGDKLSELLFINKGAAAFTGFCLLEDLGFGVVEAFIVSSMAVTIEPISKADFVKLESEVSEVS